MKAEFISSGCSSFTNIASWSKDGILAYGSSNSICIFDPLVDST